MLVCTASRINENLSAYVLTRKYVHFESCINKLDDKAFNIKRLECSV